MKKYYLLLILLTVSLQVYCKTIRGEVVDSLVWGTERSV